MKKYTYTVVWHDAGCLVKRSDGMRLPMRVRRTAEECNRIGAGLAKLPDAIFKRFAR